MSMDIERIRFTGDQAEIERQAIAGLHPVVFDKQDVLDRFQDINDSFTIAEDPQTRTKVETAVANSEKLPHDAILFIGTNGSSLTQNDGNTKELAMRAAARPHVAEMYVAQPGTGGSTSLRSNDTLRLATTGRLTQGSHIEGYKPLGSLQAMVRALVTHYEFTPKHISGDESGARIGLGLMSALAKDSVTDAYFNGIPGISKQANYTVAMVAEDKAGEAERAEFRKQNSDALESGPVTIDSFTADEMKELLPNIYKGAGHVALLGKAYGRLLPTLLPQIAAYSGHQDLGNLDKHAVFQDTQAALQRQEAIITMQFNQDSSLHDIDDCIRFGKLVMKHLPPELRSHKRGVELLIGTGSLDAHTNKPAGRAMAERAAFSSIARFMKVVFRHEGRGVYEPVLSQVAQAA